MLRSVPAGWLAAIGLGLGLFLGGASLWPVRTSQAGLKPQASVLQSPRLVIMKSRRLAHLFDGASLVRSYSVDLGRSPVGNKLRRGDDRTPEGVFHVCTKRSDSEFHRFIGIDYPSAEAVAAGLERGWVSQGEAREILTALDDGSCPRWDTALGGGIGIHGHRQGADWTAGCVAFSNEAIEELFAVLRPGDEIEILP